MNTYIFPNEALAMKFAWGLMCDLETAFDSSVCGDIVTTDATPETVESLLNDFLGYQQI